MKTKDLTYKPVASTDLSNGFDKAIENQKKNWKALEEIDLEAKKSGNILFRYIKEPVADGLAFYQITKSKNKKVFVQRCEGVCLDEYEHSYFGAGRWIDLDYAVESIRGRDLLDKLFGK